MMFPVRSRSFSSLVVWLEIPSWVLIDLDRRYFLDMKTWSLPST
jgi:hypothetical protein